MIIPRQKASTSRPFPLGLWAGRADRHGHWSDMSTQVSEVNLARKPDRHGHSPLGVSGCPVRAACGSTLLSICDGLPTLLRLPVLALLIAGEANKVEVGEQRPAAFANGLDVIPSSEVAHCCEFTVSALPIILPRKKHLRAANAASAFLKRKRSHLSTLFSFAQLTHLELVSLNALSNALEVGAVKCRMGPSPASGLRGARSLDSCPATRKIEIPKFGFPLVIRFPLWCRT